MIKKKGSNGQKANLTQRYFSQFAHQDKYYIFHVHVTEYLLKIKVHHQLLGSYYLCSLLVSFSGIFNDTSMSDELKYRHNDYNYLYEPSHKLYLIGML